jgi:hypothetical protein
LLQSSMGRRLFSFHVPLLKCVTSLYSLCVLPACFPLGNFLLLGTILCKSRYFLLAGSGCEKGTDLFSCVKINPSLFFVHFLSFFLRLNSVGVLVVQVHRGAAK